LDIRRREKKERRRKSIEIRERRKHTEKKKTNFRYPVYFIFCLFLSHTMHSLDRIKKHLQNYSHGTSMYTHDPTLESTLESDLPKTLT